jgi:DNA (cytosine-5)-methyltransferase 1
MGFPDTFKIPVSDTQAYRQFGNSVVVPVMREVARAMKPFILDVKNRQTSIQSSFNVEVQASLSELTLV